MNETGGGLGVIIFAIVFLCLFFMVFLIPIKVANKRMHKDRKAIKICCWIGLLFFPLWLVALIWSYTGEDNNAMISKQ